MDSEAAQRNPGASGSWARRLIRGRKQSSASMVTMIIPIERLTRVSSIFPMARVPTATPTRQGRSSGQTSLQVA